MRSLSSPLGPFTRTDSGSIDDCHAGRDRDGLSSDSATSHYQTCARTSPPMPAARASWPVITPCEVETIAVPIPPSTLGMCLASTYVRRPGRDTRRSPEIAERRSSVYLSRIWISCPVSPSGAGIDRPGVDVALLVEDPRELALQFGGRDLDGLVRRVDRVAHAREEVGYRVGHRHPWLCSRLLPRGLGHPGDLTVVGEIAKADATHPELAVHRARSAAAACSEYMRAS